MNPYEQNLTLEKEMIVGLEKERQEKEIALGDCVLRYNIDENGLTTKMELQNSRNEKINLLDGTPDNLVVKINPEQKSLGGFLKINKDGFLEIANIGDLNVSGSRLVLLHEIEHSKRADLDKKKMQAQKILDQYIYQELTPKEDEKKIEITVWLPAVNEQGEIEVDRFRRSIPEKIMREYLSAWVLNETESWDAALTKHQTLKKAGLDLEPKLSEEDMLKIVAETYFCYQKIINALEIEGADVMPQFIEKNRPLTDIIKKDVLKLFGQNKDNEQELRLAKTKYLTLYPEQALEIEVYFGLVDFLSKSLYLENNKVRKNISPKIYKDLTEYQFLITKYVENLANIKEAENFWIFFKTVAKKVCPVNKSIVPERTSAVLKSGIIGQVAMNKILSELGLNHSLATPFEDAYKKIDSWATTEDKQKTALQIKRYQNLDEPVIISTDNICFPTIEINDIKDEYRRKQFLSILNTAVNFAVKKQAYQRILGKEFEALMVVLPGKGIDNLTGEPSPEIIDWFKKYFNQDKK